MCQIHQSTASQSSHSHRDFNTSLTHYLLSIRTSLHSPAPKLTQLQNPSKNMIQLNHLPSSWDDLPDWPPWVNLAYATAIIMIGFVYHLFTAKEKTILETNTNNDTYTTTNNHKNTQKSDGVVSYSSSGVALLPEESSTNVLSIYKRMNSFTTSWYNIYALAISAINIFSNVVSSVSSSI